MLVRGRPLCTVEDTLPSTPYLQMRGLWQVVRESGQLWPLNVKQPPEVLRGLPSSSDPVSLRPNAQRAQRNSSAPVLFRLLLTPTFKFLFFSLRIFVVFFSQDKASKSKILLFALSVIIYLRKGDFYYDRNNQNKD
jgi:hypothetical protein